MTHMLCTQSFEVAGSLALVFTHTHIHTYTHTIQYTHTHIHTSMYIDVYKCII